MCTAITYKTKDFYMGRNLDYEISYGECVTVTPRRYPFSFRHAGGMPTHYAILGMALVTENYPFYFDAVNECGLGMAGLNFVGNAAYAPYREGAVNVSQFEFIPWLLSRCKDLAEARQALAGINLVGTPYSERFPAAKLHWLIADATGAIVVESMVDGLHVHENPVGVLTNNPPFDTQMFLLNNYMGLSARAPENRFSDRLPLHMYSRGMGALGLPGDLSSASRFVRAAFVRMNSVSADTEEESVGQVFHILTAVEQPRGCCDVGGAYEITCYTSCWNATRGIYYYTTYGNRRICAVDMHREDLDSDTLICHPITVGEDILFCN